MTETVGDQVFVEATPDVVWALVSDVPRMPSWSPELAAARWLGGTREATLGARFKGTNRNGLRRWSTTCTVTDLQPHKRFAYRVDSIFGPVAEWRYEIDGDGAGCTLRESMIDRRGWLIRSGGRVITGVSDRAAHNLDGIRRTLAAIKAAAEAA